MDTKPTLRMAGSGASEGLCAKAKIKRSDLPEAQEKFGIIFSLHFLRTFGIHLKFMVVCAIYICIHHLIAFNNEWGCWWQTRFIHSLVHSSIYFSRERWMEGQKAFPSADSLSRCLLWLELCPSSTGSWALHQGHSADWMTFEVSVLSPEIHIGRKQEPELGVKNEHFEMGCGPLNMCSNCQAKCLCWEKKKKLKWRILPKHKI